MKNKIVFSDIAMIGVLAALVYATSAFLQFPIPTPIDSTRLHMGNVMCLLSGLLLGPLYGGLAAGLGSLFFDLTNPLYIASAPFTFVFKFLMAWVCGKIAWSNNTQALSTKRNIVAAASGALLYVILYLSKGFIESYYFLQFDITVVMAVLLQKGAVSTINAIISVIVVVPLNLAIRKALSRQNIKIRHR